MAADDGCLPDCDLRIDLLRHQPPHIEVMRCVASKYDGKAGVYAAVLIEGTIRPGDEVTLMD
jgi:MOSC domain-containing protein YiiM